MTFVLFFFLLTYVRQILEIGKPTSSGISSTSFCILFLLAVIEVKFLIIVSVQCCLSSAIKMKCWKMNSINKNISKSIN